MVNQANLPLVKKLLNPHKVWQAIKLESHTTLQIAKHGYPDKLLQFLGGLGDELMLTCVARELKKRDPSLKLWQVSAAAPLLEGNPDYYAIFDRSHWVMRHSNLLNSARVRFNYSNRLPGEDNWEIPDEHIIVKMLRQAGITGQVNLRPYVFLSDTEKKLGCLADAQITIQSVGFNTHETWMSNKLWGHERLCQVVQELKGKHPHLSIIQLGDAKDPSLAATHDLRGKTNLRETAAILANSRVFLGTQGLLTHLARAVETRSVIIMGGREAAWQSGYSANINLERQPDCSPCWAMNRCGKNHQCMTDISVEEVITAVENGLDLFGTELLSEQFEIK